ncbi:hypothetical protein J3U01_04260 [Bifidobacterium sp. B4107]|uniref:hypothetical protein n=1 Tax=unclassified Bifidobacterium TaxID=2608897 RepID=UPI00226B5D7C|nr:MULTISPECIES: hypothetical protein [unclassified Bifidobacterium]MCX8647628.1 hypothetical protein [Bifidobacterium sp. B4107]MCX8651808.1 hypothetical protein [Bifidobacterium sp. B4111]
MIARIPARWVLARRVLVGIALSRLIGPWRILATRILATRILLTGWILLTSWIPGGRILTGLIGPWLIRPRILAAVLRGKWVSGIGPLTCRIPTMGILTRGILTGLIRTLIPSAKIMASGIARSLLLPVDCIWT